MTFQETKNAVMIRRIAGLLISLIFLSILINSILKYIYYAPNTENVIFGKLHGNLRDLIKTIYSRYYVIRILWNYVPIPNFYNLQSSSNIILSFCYLSLFGGLMIVAWGNALAKRLKNIKRSIEDDDLRSSLRPRRNGATVVEYNINLRNIDEPSFRQVWAAPFLITLVGGIIVLAIGAWLGWN